MADKEGAPKRSEAIVVCCAPDVCKSPDKPVPYQIVAYYSDMMNFSTNTNFNGFAATTMLSRITCVKGDEPGVGGGVSSGVNIGFCRPIDAASSTVRINGSLVLRHDTRFDMNCPGPDGTGNTQGKTIFVGMGPVAAISAEGQIVGNTDPPKGLLDQVGGFFWGAGTAAWELVEFGGKTAQYGMDNLPGVGTATDGVFNYFGSQPPAFLPSAQRGAQTTEAIGGALKGAWDNPWSVWDGFKQPYVDAWSKGNYGEAIGRGTFEAITTVFGAKGLNKLGKLKGAKVIEEVVDPLADLKKAKPAVVPEVVPPADGIVVTPTRAIGTKISQKQLRHIKDRKEWLERGKGGYLNSVEDAQKVLDAYHSGDAKVLGTTKQGHTVVQYDGVTGFNNNPGAGIADQPTNVFLIKGTSSPSVVPTNPGWTP